MEPTKQSYSVYEKAKLFDLLVAKSGGSAMAIKEAASQLTKEQGRITDFAFADFGNHYANTQSYAGLERKLMPLLEEDMKECQSKEMIGVEEALAHLKEEDFTLDYLRCSRKALIECAIRLFENHGVVERFKLN